MLNFAKTCFKFHTVLRSVFFPSRVNKMIVKNSPIRHTNKVRLVNVSWHKPPTLQPRIPVLLTFRCFSSLSRKYSRYRSAQRAIARQLYLRKHLRVPYRRPKITRPLRAKQRSYYARRVTPESLGLEEYDRSTIHSAGAASKHGAKTH